MQLSLGSLLSVGAILTARGPATILIARRPVHRVQFSPRSSTPRLAADATLLAGIQAWIGSAEIQQALRDPGDDDDEDEWEEPEELDGESLLDWEDEDEDDGACANAAPGKTAPAHARPLETSAEETFIARALREEAFLGPGDELPVCKAKARKTESVGVARARFAAAAVSETGVARVADCLSAETAAELRAFVLGELGALVRGGVDEEEAFRLVAVGSGTQRLSELAGSDSEGGVLNAEVRLGIYTILLLPIVYGVCMANKREVEGGLILPKSRAKVVQKVWAMQVGGRNASTIASCTNESK